MDFLTWQYLLKYSIAKPGAIKAYRQALINQNLSRDQLDDIAWRKTKRILSYVYSEVPWYHESFSALNLHPDDIKTWEDFKDIPVITRSDISENFNKFISRKVNPKSLKISTTGGSTGMPLKLGMNGRALREVQKWQMLSWWGVSPTANMATVYRGIPVEGVTKTAIDLINWPQRVLRSDATQMTYESIERFVKRWNKIKPGLLHGYTGSVDAMSDYILGNSMKVHSPDVIWLTASPVTSVVETKVSKAFNAKVCDQYGCSEIYFISAECPHKNGLHIFTDHVRLEVLDENNQNVPADSYGKIVLTNLDEYHFPLIRYQNGDIGRMLNHSCTCGMSLPLMDKVRGRVSDNLILPDGTTLSGEYLTTIFDDYADYVNQFQVVQHKNLNISINVVFRADPSKKQEIINRTSDTLQSRIKGKVKLTIKEVESLPCHEGKQKYIIKE
jgi:phenylacetate-CoA ligase